VAVDYPESEGNGGGGIYSVASCAEGIETCLSGEGLDGGDKTLGGVEGRERDEHQREKESTHGRPAETIR